MKVQVFFITKVNLCFFSWYSQTMTFFNVFFLGQDAMFDVRGAIFQPKVTGILRKAHTIPLSPLLSFHLWLPEKSICLVCAHLHFSNCQSQPDAHRVVCAACANFSRLGAFSSHHLTLPVAQVSRKKKDSSLCLCLLSGSF